MRLRATQHKQNNRRFSHEIGPVRAPAAARIVRPRRAHAKMQNRPRDANTRVAPEEFSGFQAGILRLGLSVAGHVNDQIGALAPGVMGPTYESLWDGSSIRPTIASPSSFALEGRGMGRWERRVTRLLKPDLFAVLMAQLSQWHASAPMFPRAAAKDKRWFTPPGNSGSRHAPMDAAVATARRESAGASLGPVSWVPNGPPDRRSRAACLQRRRPLTANRAVGVHDVGQIDLRRTDAVCRTEAPAGSRCRGVKMVKLVMHLSGRVSLQCPVAVGFGFAA